MRILGIETSCDETALSIIEKTDGGIRILANIVHSQVDIHKEYGGVFPALAKREHLKNLPLLYKKVIEGSGLNESDIEAIAVTEGPGLEPALWTGILFAKELAERLHVPLIPVNHMEGHIVSTFIKSSQADKELQKIETPHFPALALLISGGHTELIDVEKLGSYKLLGQTKDDAIGEAFDKVARMLELPYPGGPEISHLAKLAREHSIPKKIILPRPMIYSKDLNFSFSGIKTHVLYTLRDLREINDEIKADIAREFEDAVTEVLISKTRRALEHKEFGALVIGGGVIANFHIREAFKKLAEEFGIPLLLPAPGLTGDNALMIALAGALQPTTKNPSSISARGNLSLASREE